QKRPLPVYATREMAEYLERSYRYIFDEELVMYPGTARPSLALHHLVAGRVTEVAGTPVLPLAFPHGHGTVLGFRIGSFGYLTDVKEVPERELLRGIDVLVLNALWWRPHPTHLSIPEAVETAQSIGARRTILIHLTHETGHADLAARLPGGIEPGYDGQIVEIPR
ncbi:MAG TPA: MBL fold metallo-hydrolase, partial [Gemmatimonadales bacterium]